MFRWPLRSLLTAAAAMVRERDIARLRYELQLYLQQLQVFGKAAPPELEPYMRREQLAQSGERNGH